MKRIWLVLILWLCGAVLIPFAAAEDAGGILIQAGAMLHAQQVLERYDAKGEPVLQYFETWMDGPRRLQREVGEGGRPMSYAFSGEGKHLVWEAGTLAAGMLGESGVFLPEYAVMKAGFGMKTAVKNQVYAGRSCTAVLLDDPQNEEDWLKIYMDEETGFVLFCEAPLFRLRTSLLELVPLDGRLLAPPEGLAY